MNARARSVPTCPDPPGMMIFISMKPSIDRAINAIILGMSRLWRYPAFWLAACLVSMVRMYQYLVRPLLPPTCKFLPGCSEYMELAIRKHGPFVGGAKGVWRVCRCNPLSKGGIDYP